MFWKLYGFLIRQPRLRRVAATMPAVRRLARRFLAGEELESGLAALRALRARGIRGTLNHVGAHVLREDEVVAAGDAAVEALHHIQREGLEAHLSVKLTQIGLDIDEELCRALLWRVLGCARRLGNFVRIDMEESAYTERTLKLFEEAHGFFGGDTVGIAVQSYLRSRQDDLKRLLDAGARVRLVKGGYREVEAVAWHRKVEIDRAFRGDMERLFACGRLPALATHDPRFIEEACHLAAGRDRSDFEFQMLYGVRPDLQERLAREGYRVRCYVPWGRRWLPYVLGCARRLLGGTLRRLGEPAGEAVGTHS
ncbi:MAG: proline dehydrogenase family protein [Planctomycetes bacterium]|nr:proline dehydrogenase family protein [Planctomycetota bacterium]